MPYKCIDGGFGVGIGSIVSLEAGLSGTRTCANC